MTRHTQDTPCRDPAGHHWVRGGTAGFPDNRGIKVQIYRCTRCGRRTQIPPPLLERLAREQKARKEART